ncbi:class I SAM-dependent methyltransferase [Roseococcus thiosulfatophilus]|uniref:class I SAM-dependent methyltransferase n=1 Tax=Roseococcus thiosulfatophilus TaxID=35813 RepID=UPI001A8E2ED9|nr:class I SAM-dependent methyltransferase [Roseococcus thiosulfatophilus]
MSTSLAWDERYRGGGFQFGEAPNDHLRAQCWRWRSGMSALCLGDGEGRNGVFLAEQGLNVTTLDWSEVGVSKARALAARRGVALDARVGDAAAWDYPEASFDLIAWIYLHLPPADRHAAAQGCLRALKPGGLLVLECFSPAQEGRRSGGPKLPELLWSRALAEAEFAALQTLELTEGAVHLDEGPRHQGLAEVVRGVWRR